MKIDFWKQKSMLLHLKVISLKTVRTKGLEPPRRKTPDPKSGAATNYATCAYSMQSYQKLLKPQIFY